MTSQITDYRHVHCSRHVAAHLSIAFNHACANVSLLLLPCSRIIPVSPCPLIPHQLARVADTRRGATTNHLSKLLGDLLLLRLRVNLVDTFTGSSACCRTSNSSPLEVTLVHGQSAESVCFGIRLCSLLDLILLLVLALDLGLAVVRVVHNRSRASTDADRHGLCTSLADTRKGFGTHSSWQPQRSTHRPGAWRLELELECPPWPSPSPSPSLHSHPQTSRHGHSTRRQTEEGRWAQSSSHERGGVRGPRARACCVR